MIWRILVCMMAVLAWTAPTVQAQQRPLRIEITEGVIEPLPFAVPAFVAENAASGQMGQQLAQLVAADLIGTGLFREVPASAFISGVSDFNAAIQYADWKAVNAQALITGAVAVTGIR